MHKFEVEICHNLRYKTGFALSHSSAMIKMAKLMVQKPLRTRIISYIIIISVNRKTKTFLLLNFQNTQHGPCMYSYYFVHFCTLKTLILKFDVSTK